MPALACSCWWVWVSGTFGAVIGILFMAVIAYAVGERPEGHEE